MPSNDDRAHDSDARNQGETVARSADQPFPPALRRASVRSVTGSEIIGTATRRAFRDLAAKLRREVVQDLWADAGFSPPLLHRSLDGAAPAGKVGVGTAMLVSLAAWSEEQSLGDWC